MHAAPHGLCDPAPGRSPVGRDGARRVAGNLRPAARRQAAGRPGCWRSWGCGGLAAAGPHLFLLAQLFVCVGVWVCGCVERAPKRGSAGAAAHMWQPGTRRWQQPKAACGQRWGARHAAVLLPAGGLCWRQAAAPRPVTHRPAQNMQPGPATEPLRPSAATAAGSGRQPPLARPAAAALCSALSVPPQLLPGGK